MREGNNIAHFGKPFIAIAVAVAALVAIPLMIFGEPFRQESELWFIVLIPHWLAIIYLIWLAFDFRTHSFALPSVKSIEVDEWVIIVSKKEWLGMTVAVLLFKLEENFERILCPGTVINIQQNNLVQIQLNVEGLDKTEISQLRDRLNNVRLSSLIVKPGQNLGVRYDR